MECICTRKVRENNLRNVKQLIYNSRHIYIKGVSLMLYFIYFILLFMFPMILTVLINLIIDKGKIDKLKGDLKYIFSVLFKIAKIFTIICFVDIALRGVKPNEIDIKIMLLNIAYFSIFFSLIIFVNYFSTRYLKFRICMRTFLDELVKFIQNNFILNLLFFTLLFFVGKNNDLTIGLIGSYFFFVLTTVHDGYKKNINENNKDFKFLYKVMQVLLNIFILISFVSIEKIISQYSKSQPIVIEFSYTLYVLILALVIVINAFLPQIERFYKQLNIFKKRKI